MGGEEKRRRGDEGGGTGEELEAGAAEGGGEAGGRGRELLEGSRPCYGADETSDGRFIPVGALGPKFWNRLCALLERPELVNNALDRGEAGVNTRAILQDKLRTKSLSEWMSEGAVEPNVVLRISSHRRAR